MLTRAMLKEALRATTGALLLAEVALLSIEHGHGPSFDKRSGRCNVCKAIQRAADRMDSLREIRRVYRQMGKDSRKAKR